MGEIIHRRDPRQARPVLRSCDGCYHFMSSPRLQKGSIHRGCPASPPGRYGAPVSIESLHVKESHARSAHSDKL